MSMLKHFADRLTVTTAAGPREFKDVYCEVTDGVLTVMRDARVLAWFAAGQWTEASFL